MTIYVYKENDITGKEVDLKRYAGRAVLIVNTASACGFTSQYAELEELYKKHNDKLSILAFPCNQFGSQEPGTSEEIKEFCDLKFNVSFDLFEKIDVNGDDASELYKFLKKEKPGLLGSEKIKWNFTKFLVDTHGKVIKRYSPQTKPMSIEKDILELL
jgi:glutathione peroxidase